MTDKPTDHATRLVTMGRMYVYFTTESRSRYCADRAQNLRRNKWKLDIRALEGYFGSEFPAICNHFGVMAAWSRKTLEIFAKFWRFGKKRPLTGKFSKFCSKSFHRHTDLRVVCKFHEIRPTSVKSFVASRQKTLPRCPALATARIAPKICQSQRPTM